VEDSVDCLIYVDVHVVLFCPGFKDIQSFLQVDVSGSFFVDVDDGEVVSVEGVWGRRCSQGSREGVHHQVEEKGAEYRPLGNSTSKLLPPGEVPSAEANSGSSVGEEGVDPPDEVRREAAFLQVFNDLGMVYRVKRTAEVYEDCREFVFALCFCLFSSDPY